MLLLLGILAVVTAAQEKKQGQKGGKKSKNANGEEGEEEDDKFNDYEVYEAMQSMRSLAPDLDTFYDLLGLTSSATDDQIGRSFRKLSVKYHPDKHGPGTMKMFKLVQYVSTLLRDKKRKARYEWLLHEAPAWHRESVYAAKGVATAGKISLKQALSFSFIAVLLAQLVVQWIAFVIAYSRILGSKRSMKEMGEKEVKRIRKKLESGDQAFMVASNSDYERVLLADSPMPPFPTPLDLFILSAPLALIRRITGRRPALKQD